MRRTPQIIPNPYISIKIQIILAQKLFAYSLKLFYLQNKTYRAPLGGYGINNYTKMTVLHIKLAASVILFFACSEQEEVTPVNRVIEEQEFAQLSYLALGDSYTIGQSVAIGESLPKQLEKSLEDILNSEIKTEILAQTGWRTDNLLDAIATADLDISYDFVTLLIGVNNQYQGLSFEKYEKEFPELLAIAIKFADNNPNRVVVVSIPDWGFTPFGQNRDRQKISSDIDNYNAFAKLKAEELDVRFIAITDITREGLNQPELVAGDGLHPSGEAYKLFVNRIAPIISAELKD